MNKIIKMYMGIFIMMIFVSIIITLFITSINYLFYLSLKSEGYDVRFKISGYGCEINIKQINGFYEWMPCSAGDKFIIKNYARRIN